MAKKMGGKPYSSKVWAQIRKEYWSGNKTVRQISEEFGPSTTSIYRRAQKRRWFRRGLSHPAPWEEREGSDYPHASPRCRSAFETLMALIPAKGRKCSMAAIRSAAEEYKNAIYMASRVAPDSKYLAGDEWNEEPSRNVSVVASGHIEHFSLSARTSLSTERLIEMAVEISQFPKEAFLCSDDMASYRRRNIDRIKSLCASVLDDCDAKELMMRIDEIK